MEGLTKIQNQSASTLPLSDHEIEVVKKLFYVNLLSPFRVEDSMLEYWSKSIVRIYPDVTVEELQAVIDGFMTGEIEYDNKLAIQNIFFGLEKAFPAKYEKSKMVY